MRRLGATASEPVDVWIIAATNEDLRRRRATRRFREDLYHRLAVLTLALPPLRERRRDIVLLAEHFLARACADYGLPAKTLAPDARAALLAYRWPGNVRELANTMERVALLADAPVVTADVLGLSARRPSSSAPSGRRRPPRGRWPPSWTAPSGPMSRRRWRPPAGTSRARRRVSASPATRSATAWRSMACVPARRRRPAGLDSRRLAAVPATAPGQRRGLPPALTGIRWERRRLASSWRPSRPDGTSALWTPGG